MIPPKFNFLILYARFVRLFTFYLPPILSQKFRNLFFPIRWFKKLDFLFGVRCVTGSLFFAPSFDYHAYKFFFHGYFDWRVLATAIACSPAKGDIVEVGANIGTETVGFSDIVNGKGTVYAFEPLERNVSVIKSWLARSGVENVKLYPLAVGEKSGTASFCLPPERFLSGVGFVMIENEDAAISVDVVPLDDYVERFKRIFLLAIDVEGYELFVLKGAGKLIAQCRPVILLECDPHHMSRSGYTAEDIICFFADNKYEIWEIGKLGLQKPSRYTQDKFSNWVCFPSEKSIELTNRVDRILFRSGIFPVLRKLNPLRL